MRCFHRKEFFCGLDGDAFGRGGGVFFRGVIISFVGSGGVVANRGRKIKGESFGADAAVDIIKVDELVINVVTQERH